MTLTPELAWMLLTLLVARFLSFPYVLDRIRIRGPKGSIENSVPETGADQSLWAKRATAAHRNAGENLYIFAPTILALAYLHISRLPTQTAVAI